MTGLERLSPPRTGKVTLWIFPFIVIAKGWVWSIDRLQHSRTMLVSSGKASLDTLTQLVGSQLRDSMRVTLAELAPGSTSSVGALRRSSTLASQPKDPSRKPCPGFLPVWKSSTTPLSETITTAIYVWALCLSTKARTISRGTSALAARRVFSTRLTSGTMWSILPWVFWTHLKEPEQREPSCGYWEVLSSIVMTF